MRCFLVLFCIFIGIWTSKCTELASFYGPSYISIPLQEAYAKNDIEFEFRTWLPDALFLLVAGRTDFLMVQLESGLIKLRINLGAGEEEISSPEGVRFDDGEWHRVFIVRREANLTMTVDTIHFVKRHLPGFFFELNIQFGVFVGGDGHFKEQFLGHMVGLRGCISNLIYGGIDLLQHARRRQGNSKVHGVTWNCDAEFDRDVSSDISFVEDNAYIMLLHSVGRGGARWQFEMKSVSNDSILLYNSDISAQAHLIAIEIINGHLNVLLNSPKSTRVTNKVPVSDNKWHKVVVHFNPSIIELMVDTTMETARVGGSKFLDLKETYYLGGLELSQRTRATVKGVRTADSSFKGCLKGIAVNGESIGLPNAKSTFGIKSGTCVTAGLNNKTATELDILSVAPLKVVEGRRASLTSEQIRLITDYPRWGLRDSTVLLRVSKLFHGKIITYNGTNVDRFSLLDLLMTKIEYLHDGSETLKDEILLEIRFGDHVIPSLPSYLQQGHMFSIPVDISPTNDPPVVVTGVLRVAKGTRKIVTTDVLNATDPDNKPSDITYTIPVPDFKKSKAMTAISLIGQFEYVDQPQKPIFEFTQRDINDGLVVFSHFDLSENGVSRDNRSNTEYISLDVTDSISQNQTVVLMINFFDLELRIKSNKGITMVHNTSSVLQPKELSFTANVVDESILNGIRFDLVEQPKYGAVECERDKRFWEACDWFLSSEIAQKRVKYRHSRGSPKSDEFKFRASINKIRNPVVYNFTITFVKLELRKTHVRRAVLNGTSELILSNEYVQYQTHPIVTPSKSIKYSVTKIPRYGNIILIQNNRRIETSMSFTQFDVEKHNLKYVLHRRSFSSINDSVSFIVSTKNSIDIIGTLPIMYFPSKELYSQVDANFKRLQVIEGERANIQVTHLNVKVDFVSELTYNVTRAPMHGTIQLCRDKRCDDSKTCTVNSNNCVKRLSFTTEDIKHGHVYYVHDDSESHNDSFYFMAFSMENDFQYVGVFYIDVVLKNDNTPTRQIDRVLQVVINQSKLITGDDLRYSDEDINTKASDIIYTCQSITNGNLYNAKNPAEKITTFTQADIDSNSVLFKHHGDEYGKVALWITDGQFYVNGDLEIYASKPFIKILTEEMTVQDGKNFTLSAEYLNVETNLNVNGDEIQYKVIRGVKNGILKMIGKNEPVFYFKQADVDSGRISYYHSGSKTRSDSFMLYVQCKNSSAKTEVSLRILPAVYWYPLVPASPIEPLLVEESTSVVITKRNLAVLHPGIPPYLIKYYITTKPKYGYLQSSKGLANVVTIDQSIINEGRLQYIQNVANQTFDTVVFNVTNGIIWYENLELNIQIIPEHFYISTKILNVSEGGSVVITKEYLKIITGYYEGKVEEYSVVRQPKHGFVRIGNSREHVQKFTEKDLEKELVKYMHDSSENFEDAIIIIGHAGTRESIPSILEIVISPVNDQTPILVNNTGLKIWEGGCATISNTNLGATDGDFPPDNIVYKITASWWGNIILFTNSTPTQSFTQDDLEQGLVYFNHTNGTIAKFSFRLSDGVHESKEHTFVIETKPVALTLPQNSGLHVFPLNRQMITSTHLRAETSDKDRKKVFTITKNPSLGRIVIETENGNFYIIDKFTQNDLNKGRIFYEHTHPFDSLYANDSFVFSVEANLAKKLTSQVFNIDISVSSGGLDSYISITPITVDEGGSSTVSLNMSRVITFLQNHANLPAPIIHATAWPPQHGSFYVNENVNLTIFTQEQFDSGLIKYQHDHSDTLNDTLRFTLYLIPEYITLCNVSIPVKVIPINDQPFKLINQAPSMSVVFGENATITRDLLLTEDPDTEPKDLKYDIITEPSEGKILLLPDKIPANKFSQEDINDGKVIYKHSGSNFTVTFYFRVWDGKFKPVYTIFNIQIVPISIHLAPGTKLFIQQGHNVVTLTVQHLQVKTNVDSYRLSYNITKNPQHGAVYVSDSPKFSFTFSELVEGHVMYMQTDMTTASDTFEICAYVDSVAVSNTVTVTMSVQPLMQRGNFTAQIGRSTKIGLRVLDASPLVELTSGNPVYNVVSKPTHGTINKIIRSSGDHRIVYDLEVDTFSHEEIRSGLIFFVVPDNESLDGTEDVFIFMLSGSIFQPAFGELRFKIVTDKMEPELKRHHGGMHIASPNMSSDYLPIVIMLIGVLILGISVIAIIKCRSISPLKEEPGIIDGCQQPIPLPRPPDHLMASTPHLKRYISEELALPTPISVPHCKVTPLGPVESSLASSELDVHSRYPYGSAEEGTIMEDWCSHDAPSDSTGQQPLPRTNTANPLLRRNQYWV